MTFKIPFLNRRAGAVPIILDELDVEYVVVERSWGQWIIRPRTMLSGKHPVSVRFDDVVEFFDDQPGAGFIERRIVPVLKVSEWSRLMDKSATAWRDGHTVGFVEGRDLLIMEQVAAAQRSDDA